jgi:hypothetical protein
MPIPQHRWFAFRLRTLLLAIAIAALAVWLASIPPSSMVIVFDGEPGEQEAAERWLWIEEAGYRLAWLAAALCAMFPAQLAWRRLKAKARTRL